VPAGIRIRRGAEGETNRAKEGGHGEVYEKSLEMMRFRVFRSRRKPELAPSWTAGVARDEKNGSNGGGWVYD